MLSRPPKGTRKPTPHRFGNIEWPPRRGRRDLWAERRPWLIEMAALRWPETRHQRPLTRGAASEKVARRVWDDLPRRPWAKPEYLARMLRDDFKRREASLKGALESQRAQKRFELKVQRAREMQQRLDRVAEIERRVAPLHHVSGVQRLVEHAEAISALERSAREVQLLAETASAAGRTAHSDRSES